MNPADWPAMPPGYTLRLCVADAFETACQAARDGAEDGLMLMVDRPDRCEAALVLRPLDPIQPALTLAYVGLLGLHDGLAALAPAETPASIGWPDRLLVNEACVGGVQVVHGPLVEKDGMADVPDWLVLGITVQMSGDRDDDTPGVELEYTNLYEEGCGEVTVPQLIEAFARHLLHWLDRWQEDGFEPVRRAVLHDLQDKGLRIEPNGDAWFEDGTVKAWRGLRDALRHRSWVLPEPVGQVS
ncbi:biotin/lipoate--protein ligase family protein [Ferrovibrio sp.]|uniref:biotin/lipoate--protein ligase family protein n=1 Tax=Ferrovibrio sp. TaxID=1917215 RepID=UPI002609FAEE|nr:biotin/lipoate--protein ligase family protein [Ferrovibrio sp.]